MINFIKILISGFIFINLISCSTDSIKVTQPDELERLHGPRDVERLRKTKAGKGLINEWLLGKKEKNSSGYDNSKIDNDIWNGSLEVLTDFPLSSVDYKSGLITTEWYISERKPSERFKITVLVLSNRISSEAVKVKIHRQVIKNNRWVNTNIDSKKSLAIQRKIIGKASQIKSQK